MSVERSGTIEASSEPAPGRPMTGEEYLDSLRDGREIWLYGERVADVTTHPAFRNTARMIARLYDALHDPSLKGVLTTETDTGSGGYTHRYFRVPRSWEDQLAGRDHHLVDLRGESAGVFALDRRDEGATEPIGELASDSVALPRGEPELVEHVVAIGEEVRTFLEACPWRGRRSRRLLPAA